LVCSTARVSSDDYLAGGRLELTLEGLTFLRSKSSAANRGTGRAEQVDWADIVRAGLATPAVGKPILWVEVAGSTVPPDSARGPYSYKVKRRQVDQAVALVAEINRESGTRRRWSGSDPGEP
jgi:hypothetical protein